MGLISSNNAAFPYRCDICIELHPNAPHPHHPPDLHLLEEGLHVEAKSSSSSALPPQYQYLQQGYRQPRQPPQYQNPPPPSQSSQRFQGPQPADPSTSSTATSTSRHIPHQSYSATQLYQHQGSHTHLPHHHSQHHLYSPSSTSLPLMVKTGLGSSGSSASSQQSPKLSPEESEILRKRLYRVGLNLFNKKPEVGIAYLVRKKFLEGTPPTVARFLVSRKGLSKQMIGEYLTNLQSPFSMSCLE